MKYQIPYTNIHLNYTDNSDEYPIIKSEDYPIKFEILDFITKKERYNTKKSVSILQQYEMVLMGSDLILTGSDGYFYYASWTVANTNSNRYYTAFDTFKLDIEILEKLLSGHHDDTEIFYDSINKFGKIFLVMISNMDKKVKEIIEYHIDNYPRCRMYSDILQLIEKRCGCLIVPKDSYSDDELAVINKFVDEKFLGINNIVNRNFINVTEIKREILLSNII